MPYLVFALAGVAVGYVITKTEFSKYLNIKKDVDTKEKKWLRFISF